MSSQNLSDLSRFLNTKNFYLLHELKETRRKPSTFSTLFDIYYRKLYHKSSCSNNLFR